MKLDGNTTGRRVYVDGTCDGKVIKRLWFYRDGCKHCRHATRMRLRRVPKWVNEFDPDYPVFTLEELRRSQKWARAHWGKVAKHKYRLTKARLKQLRSAGHDFNKSAMTCDCMACMPF